MGIEVVRVGVEDAGADASEMFMQEFDFFVRHSGTAGSRFGQREGQPWQPVTPLDSLAEFPTEFVVFGYVPRPRRRGDGFVLVGDVVDRGVSGGVSLVGSVSFAVRGLTSNGTVANTFVMQTF